MALRVSLIGLGALGILYTDFLLRQPEGCSLTVIADRERQARYARDGILCNGRRLEPVFAAPDETPAAPADLMIVAVKGTGLAQAMEDMRGHMGPGTIVLSLLNGITSEEVIEARFPEARVLRCVAQAMDAMREGQHMLSSTPGWLIVGATGGRDDLADALDQVLTFLQTCGIPCRRDDNIEHRLYAKWMLNVGVNQTVTVFQGSYATLQQPGRPRDVCLQAMREAMAVACAEGVALTGEDLAEYTALMDHLNPEGLPSMRQDALAGRPTEAALFSGALLEKAARHGIAAPVNAWLHEELAKIGQARQCRGA